MRYMWHKVRRAFNIPMCWYRKDLKLWKTELPVQEPSENQFLFAHHSNNINTRPSVMLCIYQSPRFQRHGLNIECTDHSTKEGYSDLFQTNRWVWFNGYELVCIILTKLNTESESGSVFTIHQNSEVRVLVMLVTLHVIEFLNVTEYVWYN
jgi:hypothetical protein